MQKDSKDELNDLNKLRVNGKWMAMAEIAPPEFCDFVLTKARELANVLR
jgi:hypothetical protein